MNFLDMLRNNPRGWGNGAGPEPEIAYQDDGGNLYGFNNALLQKAPAPQQGFGDQSLTDMLIGIGSAPAKMATGLASGMSPYGSEGFQVPPLAMDAWEAINAPGTILNEGMTPQDRDRTATNAAGFMMGGGLVAPKPTNTLGMFGGRMAKTADHNALAKAEDLASRGAPREQIWNETGWFQGPDQKWRFEIDDSGSGIARFKSQNGPLSSILDHDHLTQAYPDVASIPVDYKRNQGIGRGGYDAGGYRYLNGSVAPEGISIEAPYRNQGQFSGRSIGLHEAQHAIQNREGFTPGSSPTNFTSIGVNRQMAIDNPGVDLYRRVAGEVEARNVQKRMDMGAEERRATPPWLTQDIADADQIVNLFSNGSKPGAAIGNSLVESQQGKGFTAYHGSPHDFDKFSLDKIGTGEGAQAYGHGLYFADNEAVAQTYKGAGPVQQWSELDPPNIDGKMYEVRINADPESFLDWDKPLSQQSEAVRNALSRFGVPEDATGAKALDAIGAKSFWEGDASNLKGNVSSKLSEEGIPGIRYLDGNSRGTGEGSSNYVVFDDSLIDILRKYGLTGGAIGAGSLLNWDDPTTY